MHKLDYYLLNYKWFNMEFTELVDYKLFIIAIIKDLAM